MPPTNVFANDLARTLARLTGLLSLAGAAVLVTVLLFELGARLFVPSWTPKHGVRNFWIHDELLGWRHNADVSGMHRHRDFEVAVRTNPHGFRDVDYPVERVPGKKRMLFLGDSFGFGFGVEHEEIMTEIMERKQLDWEIINTAVAGWGTDQQLLFMRDTGHHFRPDVVLLLFHPNDVEDNNDYMRYGYYKPQFLLQDGALSLTRVPVRQLSGRQKIDRFLYQRTYVLTRIWKSQNLLGDWLEALRRASRGNGGRPTGPEAAPPVPQVAAPPPEAAPPPPQQLAAPPGRDWNLDVSRALVGELNQVIRESGARLVVVSVPGRPDPQALLAGLLPELGVPYLPLDPAFQGRPRLSFAFPHDPHWNAEGQRIAAEATERFLVDVGIFR